MMSTPWPMRSAWPRSTASRMWKREAVGWDEAGGEFAGVEAMWTFGIDAVEVVEHEHLAVVLGHGQVGVFGLHEVDADDGVGPARRARSRGGSGRRPAGAGARRT